MSFITRQSNTKKTQDFSAPSLTSQLQESFGRDASRISEMMQKQIQEMEQAKRLSLVPEGMTMIRQKRTTCRNIAEAIEISDDLRFISHVFLDGQLNGSKLEGFTFRQIIPLIKQHARKAHLPIELAQKLTTALDQLYEIDSLIKIDTSITKDVFLDLCKKNILGEDKKWILEIDTHAIIKDILDSQEFQREVSIQFKDVLFSSETIYNKGKELQEKYNKYAREFISRFLETDPDLNENKQELEKIKKNLKFTSFYLAFKKENYFFQQLRKENKKAVLHIVNSIKQLQTGQTLYVPSGYNYYGGGHAIILLFEKNEDTLNLSILNTGAGTHYHTLFSDVDAYDQENQIGSYPIKKVICPVMEFRNIPLSDLLIQNDGTYTFFQFIVDAKTLPFQMAYDLNIDLCCKLYYKTLCRYFLKYMACNESSEESLLTHPQESGTCVWSSIKTILRLMLQDHQIYDQFMEEFKTQLLLNGYIRLVQEDKRNSVHSDEEALVTLLCAKRFLTSLENKVENKKSIEEWTKVAIATTSDIIERLSCYLDEKDVVVPVRRENKKNYSTQYNLSDDDVVALQELLADRNSSCFTNRPIQIDALIENPRFDIEKPSFSTIHQMQRDLDQLHIFRQTKSRLSYIYIENYIDSIVFDVDKIEEVENPEMLLESLTDAVLYVNQNFFLKNEEKPANYDERRFLRSWKAFLIAIDLIEQMHPGLLRQFPLDSYGFLEGKAPLNFLADAPVVQENLRLCMRKVLKHNEKADPRFSSPLFNKINNISVELNNECTEPKHSCASYELYKYLIENSENLRRAIQEEKKQDTSWDVESQNMLMMTCTLFEDLNREKGILARHGLKYISNLKALYLATANTLNGSYGFITTPRIKIDEKEKLLRCTDDITNTTGFPLIFHRREIIENELIRALWALRDGKITLNGKSFTWGDLSSLQKDLYLLNITPILLSSFPKLAIRREDIDFLKDLFLASNDLPFLYERIFTLLTQHIKEKCLSNPLIQEVIKNLLFGVSAKNPEGMMLYKSLASQEYLRQSASTFLKEEIDRFVRQEHIDEKRLRLVFNLILAIKRGVHPVPFMPDFAIYIEDQLGTSCEIVTSTLLDHEILFNEELHTKDSLKKILLLSLQINHLSSSQKYFISQYLPSVIDELSHPVFLSELAQEEIFLKEQLKKQEMTYHIEYDNSLPILWIIGNRNDTGIDLISHNHIIRSKEGQYFKKADSSQSYLSEHPLFNSLKATFPSMKAIENDSYILIETDAGIYTISKIEKEDDDSDDSDDDYEFKSVRIIYEPSFSFEERLDEKYKGKRWQFITERLFKLDEHPYSSNHTDSENADANWISADLANEQEMLDFLTQLPYHTNDILYLYGCKVGDDLAILTASQSQQLSYVIEVQAQSKTLTIHQLSTSRHLIPLKEDSMLKMELKDLHCYKMLGENEDRLIISDKNNRSIEIHETKHGMKIPFDDEKLSFAGTTSKHFPFSSHLLAFTSDRDKSKHFIIISGSSPLPSRGLLSQGSLENFSLPYLFLYEIINDKIIAPTLSDAVYLSLLKIQNKSADRFHELHKLLKLHNIENPPAALVDISRSLIRKLEEKFFSAETAKDEYCLLFLHLSAFLFKNSYDSIDEEDTLKVYKHYKTRSSIPERYLLSIDIEKIIVNKLDQARASIKTKEYKEFLDTLSEDPIEFTIRCSAVEMPTFDFPEISNAPSYKKIEVLLLKENKRLWSRASAKEIISYHKEKNVEGLRAIFFNLVYHANMEIDGYNEIVLAKLCLCLEANTLSILGISEELEEGELLAWLLEDKNIPYLNEILKSWQATKDSSPLRNSQQRKYLYQPVLTPIVFERSQRKIVAISNADKKYRMLVGINQRSLGISIMLMQSQKIAHLSKMLFDMIYLEGNTTQIDKARFSIKPSSSTKSISPKGLRALDHVDVRANRGRKILSKGHSPLASKDLIHHAGVFFSSLALLIEEKENNLLSFIRSIHESKDSRASPFIRLAAYHSDRFAFTTFDDLIYPLLEGSDLGYQAILSPISHVFDDWQKIPREKIELIHEEIATVLLLKIWNRKLTAVRNSFDKCQVEELLSLFKKSDILNTNYSEHNIHWLAFEYLRGIDLREKQRAMLRLMEASSEGSHKNGVAQLMMGEGKSSVLLPLLSYSSAGEEKIALVICLKAQIETMISSLRLSQNELFAQRVIPITLSRHEMTEEAIEKLLCDLNEAPLKKYLFITTPETLQTLELEYFKQLCSTNPSAEYKKNLRQILLLFREKCNCIVDEFAHIADVSKVTNLPLTGLSGDSTKLPEPHIDLMRTIFHYILIQQAPAFKKISDNEQIYLTDEEHFVIRSSLRQFVKDLFIERYPTLFTASFLETMLSQERIAPDIHKILKDVKDQSSAQLLALAHLCIHAILPKVLRQCGQRNYGRSIEGGKEEKIIPYQGVSSPATTEFGFPYETLAYHFLYAAQFGIDKPQIASLANRLANNAQAQAKSEMIPLQQTEGSCLLYLLTGMNVKEVDSFEAIEKARARLEKERKEGNFETILKIEALSAHEHITCFSKYLSSNPHDLFSQCKTVRGLTGTPWNHTIYNHSFLDNIHLDHEIEKRIVDTYCTKPTVEGIGHFAIVTNKKNAKEIIQQVLTKIEAAKQKDVSALIDTGALLKDYTNKEVAEQILQVLKISHQLAQKISILFFSDSSEQPLPDVAHIMQFDREHGTTKVVEVCDFSSSTLKDFGVMDHPYFVYFDERHTVGTDIILPKEAIALLTIDGKTALYQFTQGMLRARQFFLQQRVLTIIPEKMLDIHPDSGASPEMLIAILQKNQDKILSSQTIRSYQMQIENVCRRYILDHQIRDIPIECKKGPQKANDVATLFIKVFLKQETLNLVELIRQKSSHEDAIQELKDLATDLLDMWKKIELNDGCLTKITHTIEGILENAKHCPHMAASSGYHALFQEVFVEQQIEQQVEQQVEQEVEIELTRILNGQKNIFTSDPNLDLNQIIAHYQIKKTSFLNHATKDYIFHLALIKFNPNDPPYQRAIQTIQLSNRSIDVKSGTASFLFNPRKKKLISLLIIERTSNAEDTPAMIALTYGETKQAIEFLSSNNQDGVFLVNMQGQLLCDSYQSLALTRWQRNIETALVEMNVFNMDIKELTKWSQATYHWLNPGERFQSLAPLRERFLKMICTASKKTELLPVVASLKRGSFQQNQTKKAEIAKTMIAQAEQALGNSDLISARKTLMHYPKEQLRILPDLLCHLIGKEYLSHLTLPKQISSLVASDCVYLQKGQTPYLTSEKIEEMIKRGRIDIDAIAVEKARGKTLGRYSSRSMTIDDIIGVLKSEERSLQEERSVKSRSMTIDDIIDVLKSEESSLQEERSVKRGRMAEHETQDVSDARLPAADETKSHSTSNMGYDPSSVKRSSLRAREKHKSEETQQDAPFVKRARREKSPLEDFADAQDIYSRPTKASEIPHGFPNLGNTCYINALCKALFHTKVLDHLTKYSENEKGSILNILAQLAYAYKMAPPNIPELLFQLTQHKTMRERGFTIGKMHDADEFCRLLYGVLDLNNNAAFALNSQGSPSALLSLHPPHGEKIAMQELIVQTLEMQLSHLNVTQLSMVSMQISRFQDMRLKNEIEIHGILDEQMIVVTQADGSVSFVKLTPTSVVCHSGSLNVGHYTAITISEEGITFLHDDDITQQISKKHAEEIASRQAYLVYYKAEIDE